MKTAIYARVSTDRQDTGNQTLILQDWLKSRGWELAAVYEEQESAWKAGHQRVLSRLINDARLGKFKQVVVWALDRLSREGITGISSVWNRLGEYHVRLISHEEQWTESPNEVTPLLLAIFGWIANMESKRRSERTKAGLLNARHGGKVLGRPKGSKDRKKRNRRQRITL